MGRAPSINSIVCTSFISLSGGTLKGSSAGNKAAYRVRIFLTHPLIYYRLHLGVSQHLQANLFLYIVLTNNIRLVILRLLLELIMLRSRLGV